VFAQSNQAPPKGHGALRLILLVATGLIALATTAALSALSSAESRPEVATLVAVGASPRTRRSIAAARAGVVVGLGGVLAIPAGMLPAMAVLAVRRGHPIVIPWATFGAVGLLLPLLAMSAAWALSRPPGDLLRPAA
jgi:putative ABC transport system permease protein